VDASDPRAAVARGALRLRRALAGTVRSTPAVVDRAAALSSAYRSGTSPSDPRGHVHDAASAEAYAAARMPATFAAIGRALAEAAERLPDSRPTSLLDVGAGTGAAAWAACDIWPTLADVRLVDRERAMVDLGRRLAIGQPAPLATAEWGIGAIEAEPLPTADLVTATYLLGELPAGPLANDLVARLWSATREMLLIVEPGSRAGFERIRTARASLIAAGGHLVAPCPGDEPCPIAGAAWCHFLARLDRSPLQRAAKGAARSWEDEPFSYIAVARTAGAAAPRVVLGRPRHRPGLVELRICVDGRIEQRIVSRRDGAAWQVARDLAWGDALPVVVGDRLGLPAGGTDESRDR
jgi:ribosomal protein RSM22 (predicted rRNA methylase)